MTDWDERYRVMDELPPPHPLVLQAAQSQPPGRALDLACGLGRHALALASLGWQVTAVDASQVALERLQALADAQAVSLQLVLADLARGEFVIEAETYDLIVITCYLQRDLFQAVKQGVRPGGVFVGAIALEDADSTVRPMNPAFLLKPSELGHYFQDWELVICLEAKPETGQRAQAQLIARRPLT